MATFGKMQWCHLSLQFSAFSHFAYLPLPSEQLLIQVIKMYTAIANYFKGRTTSLLNTFSKS